MKIIKNLIILLFIGIGGFSSLSAQIFLEKEKPFIPSWEEGYVILEDKPDTIRGLIAIECSDLADPLSYKLTKRYKAYFISLISDDAELVKKIETDLNQLRFYNVLKIVQEYNEWAKSH
ncbi:MAG TPA: hypothetical protein VFF27_13510 [Bacteroidia bacterium]|jgi:hypothetical protein|nr:hypothetical protein [Bacteroidia bacterium]